MATKQDFYETLGVSKTATADEIKKSYRKLALEWHPDRNKSPNANEKFKEINEAYAVLSNPEKRSAYDQYGHAAFAPGGGAGQGPFGGGFRQQGPFSYTSYGSSGGSPFGEDFIDPFEIFEQFFGGGFSQGGASWGGRGGRAKSHPSYEIAIDFDEAVRGVTKEIMIPKGRAGEGTERKTIKIPAGIDTGNRIRFDDFDIIVSVRPSSKFERNGDDIIVTHEISYTKAALGCVEEVPTVEKPVKIRIPAGTQPGTVIRLRSQGIAHVRGGGRGDEYVKIQIAIPTHLSKRQRELLSELENS